MKIGVICAMEEELRVLVENLDFSAKKTRHGFIFHTGSIGRHDLVLVQSGIGKVMSAISVTLLCQLFNVEAIINTGSAGALDSRLKIGDLVIAEKLAYHDVDVTAFGYKYGQMAGQDLFYKSSRYFIAELKRVTNFPQDNIKVGLITSSDSFIASPEKAEEIRSYFPEVLAVEMEGASVAQAAKSLNKPFLIIRAISDTANHEANINFDEFILEAGRKSALLLIKLLKSMI
ncbi:MAG: 5'-methylthioadenosine/adenosylhomocysteine nucleosidase [Lactovum sp.]